MRVTSVKEHVSDNSRLPVDLERMTAEHNPLADDSVRIDREEGARCHQNMATICHRFEDQHWLRRVAHWRKDTRHTHTVRMKELLKLDES